MSPNTLLLTLFLFLLPTQLGRHFFLPFSYLSGIRVDYLAPTLYLIDIVFIFLLTLNIKTVWRALTKKHLYIFLALLGVNLLVSQNKIISLYQYLRMAELLLIYLIIKKSAFPAKNILAIFLASSLIQLGLSLFQLAARHSAQGIFYFLGERYFNLMTPGIARISFFGVEAVRPYGTFSHPNSLAGFYLLSYFFVLIDKKFKDHLFLKNSFLLVSSLLVLISFSKIAILTFLFLNIFYVLWRRQNKCLICAAAKIVVFLVVSLIFLAGRADPLTVEKRLYLLGNSLLILKNHFLFGVGAGNYLVAQNNLPQRYLDIVNQPVHNIFLLFLSEWGLFGSILVSLIFKRLEKNIKKFIILFLVILATGFFDHYWLTLVQNLFLLPVVFGLL